MSYKSQDLLSAALDESGLGPELTQFRNFQPQPVYQVSPQPVENSPLAQLTSIFSPQQFHGNNLVDRKSVLNKTSSGSFLVNPSVLVNRQNSLKNEHLNGVFERQSASSAGLLSNKSITKLWKTNDIKLSRDAAIAKSKTEDEVEEEEEEELGHAETYAEYMPSKLKIGQRHPDPVVETSSLSSVHPPDVWYNLCIPEECIDYRYLSALQLEAIVYASQQHDQFLRDGTRAGYLIGDGAGVGKGRTIAGIIYENYLQGRKRAIWVSVSNDLKYDAQRDLKDIGASKIEVHALNKFKYGKITSKTNGSVKKGVIFSTYSALIGESQSGSKYRTRLKQLLHWCGVDYDGVIVFDECHKAKNLCPIGSSKPTKTGLTVLDLQNRLPKARVVYASATGASEPKNMAYMTRLGIWGPGTPFREFSDFIQAVEKRGVGAMELVAMDMKLRGMYIARQLSFTGVTFRIEEIPLGKDFIRVYDDSVRLWVEAREKFQQAAELIDAEQRMRKTMWGQFWSAHQRFFKYLCIASKVDHVVKLAREAVKDGRCVVIGLQSTGEARTLEQLEEAGGELNDFVSTAKGVLQTLIQKHFPAPDRKRINRLLGFEPAFTPPDSPTTSGMKRKLVGKSNFPAKKAKKESDESSEDEKSDSDVAGSESDDYQSHASSGGMSDSGESDFNPFGDGSGSDDDPWVTRKNKKKEKLAKKKKKKKKKKVKKEKKCDSPWSMKAKTESIAETNGNSNEPPKDAIERACSMKEELLERLEQLDDKLPPNTLDQLIDELGGPENVAEMTGRKGRIVSNDEGIVHYESRSEIDVPLETLNLTEKQRFMDGEKHIAIISEAASSGISLQSDRRAKNQRRRVHITLELPWSADRAIQQFGRTHRSNQMNAPEYLFLISDLAGERRFASIVAKRLESLGALTHGDRRATESRDLSRFNIDNKYGRTALEMVMKSVMLSDKPLVPCPSDYQGDFFADIRTALIGVGLVVQDERYPNVQNLDKDHNNISKFLNRILGMEVDLQNRLFKYFSDTLAAIIAQAKKAGRFDMGILDLGTTSDQMKRTKKETFCFKHATGTTQVSLNTVTMERGMSWDQAVSVWCELTGKEEGFYLAQQVRNGKQPAILAVEFTAGSASRKRERRDRNEKVFSVYRPNTGLQFRQETLTEILKKYSKASTDLAQPHWQDQYDSATDVCSHAYWRGSCRRVMMGMPCDVGLRRRTYHVLDGSVLSVWGKVESVLAATMPASSHNTKMQVIRLRLQDGQRIVGILVPTNFIQPLTNVLTQDSTKLHSESF
uniref:Strawberry notch n=1 Tax=Strigamia maritima TaxID=126957 RepID=T1IRW6_STRMM